MILHLATGPRQVPDLAPAFAAPPGLAEIVEITRPGPSLFFDVPPRVQMRYRTRESCGFMAAPLRAVSMLSGRVIVEVLGQWVLGEVRRG